MTIGKNFQVRLGIESKLAQSLSLIRVISDNHYYKDEGLDEPFIEHNDAGHLIWLLNTLLEEVYKGFLDMNFKGGKNNG